MTEQTSCIGRKFSRQEISDDVTRLGWRYNLGLVRTAIRVGSLAQAAEVAQAVTALAGDSADRSLSADLRPDRVILTLQSRAEAWPSGSRRPSRTAGSRPKPKSAPAHPARFRWSR